MFKTEATAAAQRHPRLRPSHAVSSDLVDAKVGFLYALICKTLHWLTCAEPRRENKLKTISFSAIASANEGEWGMEGMMYIPEM